MGLSLSTLKRRLEVGKAVLRPRLAGRGVVLAAVGLTAVGAPAVGARAGPVILSTEVLATTGAINLKVLAAGLLPAAAGAWLVRRRRRRDAGNPQRPRFPGAVTAGPVEFRHEAGAVLARPGPAEPLCPWEPALARERIDQLSAAGGGVTPAEVWKRMGVS